MKPLSLTRIAQWTSGRLLGDDAQITRFAAQNLGACGFSLVSGHASKPHHVPASSEIVASLLDVYHEITGLDAHTLAYADFRGNRQYLSVGNLGGNPRMALILMDYPTAAG